VAIEELDTREVVALDQEARDLAADDFDARRPLPGPTLVTRPRGRSLKKRRVPRLAAGPP
jgi:hypothetical protein